jgi:hypothetical protein
LDDYRARLDPSEDPRFPMKTVVQLVLTYCLAGSADVETTPSPDAAERN